MASLSSPNGECLGFVLFFFLQLKICNCLFILYDINKDAGYVHLDVNPHPDLIVV